MMILYLDMPDGKAFPLCHYFQAVNPYFIKCVLFDFGHTLHQYVFYGCLKHKWQYSHI